MRELLDDGLSALADLLQSGADSCHPETERRLERLGREWEDAGLHTGSALLAQIAQALAARRHGGEGEEPGLMELVDRCARYTRLCQQKYALDQAGQRLCRRENEEEDHETTE